MRINRTTLFICFLLVLFVHYFFPVDVYGSTKEDNRKFNNLNETPVIHFFEDKYQLSALPFLNFSSDLLLPVPMSDYFRQSDDKMSMILDLGMLNSSLDVENTVWMSASFGMFSYIKMHKKGTLGFNIYDQFNAGFYFNNNLVGFINRGNAAFVDEPLATTIKSSVRHYNTWQVTYSKPLNDKWNIGLSGKLYFGKSTLSLETDILLETNISDNFLQIELQGNVLSAAPIQRSINRSGFVNGIAVEPDFSWMGYLFDFKNPGLGIDIGLSYELSPTMIFSASILDLGFIAWFGNKASVDINGKHKWEGFDISELVKYPTDRTVINDLKKVSVTDSLFYSAISANNEVFITPQPLTLFLGADYELNGRLGLHFANRFSFFDGYINNKLHVRATYLLGGGWSFNSGIALVDFKYFYVPFEIGFSGKQLRLKLNVNNSTALIFPDKTNYFGGSLSVSWLFDKYTPEEREKMKNLPFFKLHKKKKLL
jgi:hypothetical protein